jgi:hypothetical protein
MSDRALPRFAAQAFSASILRDLPEDALLALDAFARRALNNPNARPVGEAEQAAWERLELECECRRPRPFGSKGRRKLVRG